MNGATALEKMTALKLLQQLQLKWMHPRDVGGDEDGQMVMGVKGQGGGVSEVRNGEWD